MSLVGCSYADLAEYVDQHGLLISSRLTQPQRIVRHLVPSYRHPSLSSGAVVTHDPSEVGVVCYQGITYDLHNDLSQLSGAPAGMAVVSLPQQVPEHMSYLQVSCPRSAWALCMGKITGKAHDEMCLCGVTGTNGKTSSVWMLHEILRQFHLPHLVIGTFGYGFSLAGEPVMINADQGMHTTPDPSELFPLLYQARSKGIRHVVMEVSSHGLDQKKLFGVRFDQVAFTSFSRDHLEHHRTMEDYFAAKWQLFCPPYSSSTTGQWVSESTTSSPYFKKYMSQQPLGDGSYQWRVVRARPMAVQKVDKKGVFQVIDFTVNEAKDEARDKKKTYKISSIYAGQFMQQNLAMALRLAERILQRSLAELLTATDLTSLRPVPGRMNLVHDRPWVFIDYAHSPDALQQALISLHIYQAPVWVVFGCGGNRDTGKRPLMGKVALKYSNRVFVTSDNPRHEPQQQIAKDIIRHIPQGSPVVLIDDRAQAIHTALDSAEDFYREHHIYPVILIAGKGHETFQILQDTKQPLSDYQIVEEYYQSSHPLTRS